MARGATGTYGLPYPLQTDEPDVAADVQSLATAVEIELIAKATLDSPALTGIPTAPTAATATDTTQIATTAYVKAQGYLTTATASTTYSPIASPTFTGVPAAPTAAVNTNTTQIATTAFVNAEISNDAVLKAGSTMTGSLILPAGTTTVVPIRIPHGSAPTSPTNGDIWTTTTGMYARINGNTIGPFGAGGNYQSAAPSPAITGMIWVDQDTDVLYIYTGAAWISPTGIERNAQSGTSYTLLITDRAKLVEMGNAAANTLTVPPNSSVAFPIGTQIQILQTGAGQTTIVEGAGVTVNATPGKKLREQWSSATIIKRATDTWVAVGDLIA